MFKRLLIAAVLAACLVAQPAWAATNFLEAAGTGGYLATATLMTTELNALASGACIVSSVNGSSGVFSQTTVSSAPQGSVWFTSGGAFTPSASQTLYGWFEISKDAGTTFESQVTTCSTTVPPFARNADFQISLAAAAYASGNIAYAGGRTVPLPWESYKVVLWNIGTTALPATGNTISVGGTVLQY
jgi:hypothetical protein